MHIGWCEAGSLQVGDNVISVNLSQFGALFVKSDTKDSPAQSSQDRFFASILSGFTRGGVPVTAVYFNGEFYVRVSQVDIDSLKRKIGDRGESSLGQGIVNNAFVLRFESTEFALGAEAQGFKRVGHTSNGIVGVLSQSLALFWSRLTQSQRIGFTLSSRGESPSFKSGNNGSTGYPESVRYFFHGHQLVEVHIDNSVGIQRYSFGYRDSQGFQTSRNSSGGDVEVLSGVLAGDALITNHILQQIFVDDSFTQLKSPFELDSIVSVFISKCEEPVYNLTVVDNHTYIADSVVSHNCQCVMIRVPVGWGWDEFGDLVPGGKVDLYESPEELALAMMQEDDLQKAFALQGHVMYQGIPIAIENKEGSIRKWGDSNGEHGETKMVGVDYGYVEGTLGTDEDEIDVFVGPDPRAGMVYIVEQQNSHTGQYDEQKCFLGFPNQKAAEQAYRLHYDDPDKFIITIESMELNHFKRWVSVTKPKKGELFKAEEPTTEDDTKLVILVPERLEKAAAIGGKYVKRVPYTDKHGKKRYRYYYTESAIARDVKAGEVIKLGKQFAQVKAVDADGTIHLKVGSTSIKVAPGQWDSLLATHYGDTYFKWAEKRAVQSVNAVLKHVPKADLADLKGTTDKERLADLKIRVPKVYDKLQKSFSRAGVNLFRAKQLLTTSLERRGWEPEARAAVIGDVITKRNQNYRTTIQAAENLAGGGKVTVGHVGAVTEILKFAQSPEKNKIAELPVQASKELVELSTLLAEARGGTDTDAANALAAALSSQAIQKLNMITKAFPGVQDDAVEPAREIMLEVSSVVPTQAPKSTGGTTTVFVAGEGGQPKALNAQYKLVEADDAIASHDPRTFNKREDYPEDVQERAYHRDVSEQAKVQRNAQRLRPEFVVNTNPDAVNGPPIMGPDGVVLGGNSRTMSVQLAYAKHPEKATELKSYLREHAHEAGFTKKDVDQFKNPMLVRVVEDGGETKKDKQLLVRRMNESFTQAMDLRTMQVAMGRKLTNDTLEELGNAMSPDETLNEFLATKRAEPFINALQKVGIIDQRNSNQYFMKGTKKLNPDGRTLVARILVGRTIGDADLLSATKPRLVENMARSVPYMAQAKTYGEGFDLADDLKVALDAYNSLQYRVDTQTIPALNADMTEHRFGNLFGQQEMFGGAHPVTQNPKAMGLLEVLIRRPGATQITEVFKDYAEQAKLNPENQTSVFGAPKSATDILKQVVTDHMAIAKKPKRTPIKKSLSVDIGAVNSRAGNRGPGPGLGINYVIPMPVKQNLKTGTGYFPTPRNLMNEQVSDEIGALHVSKRDYEFSQRQRNVHPYELPEEYIEAGEDAREGTEERSAYVKNEGPENVGRPKNTAVVRTPIKKKKKKKKKKEDDEDAVSKL